MRGTNMLDTPTTAESMIIRLLRVNAFTGIPFKLSLVRKARRSLGEFIMTSALRADKQRKSDQVDKVGFAMTTLRLDSFDVFVAIVRCGGFRAAALERGV